MTTPHTPSAEKMSAVSRAFQAGGMLVAGLLLFAPATARAALFTYTTATGTGADAQVYRDQPWEPEVENTNYGSYGYPGVKYLTTASAFRRGRFGP